ncbi:hypothetical protein Hs30E_12550 [Lactococcus hodotermopsidis]|uniref:Uncharacterized protein n=1 Tax=Pseudolactococcus hodotermopsidis TaxID=2709157 RepID=A0A6A0BDZ7_9LACT|nr:hypothetical protein [Lactococcus hodotermopsidis]GFH42704.1 hypothetical protein Hs30E_12550 [Lactococcus hodotermopsidis]
MSIILAIIAGILTLLNYYLASNNSVTVVSLISQLVIVVLASLAMARYNGAKAQRNYEIGKPRILTLSFAIILLILMVSIAVLIIFFFNLTGKISSL